MKGQAGGAELPISRVPVCGDSPTVGAKTSSTERDGSASSQGRHGAKPHRHRSVPWHPGGWSTAKSAARGDSQGASYHVEHPRFAKQRHRQGRLELMVSAWQHCHLPCHGGQTESFAGYQGMSSPIDLASSASVSRSSSAKYEIDNGGGFTASRDQGCRMFERMTSSKAQGSRTRGHAPSGGMGQWLAAMPRRICFHAGALRQVLPLPRRSLWCCRAGGKAPAP